jgi:uncharacterized protein (UPF0335 family)
MVFKTGADNQDTTNGTNDTPDNQSYVDRLVAAKGEQWADPEMIAKGKLESDAYIVELKRQLEEAEAKSTSAAKLEDLISKIEKKAAEPVTANSQSNDPDGAQDSNTKNSLSEDDLQSLVEKALTKREEKNTLQQNIEQVNSQLEEMFGTEAASIVQKKAQETGLSLERLQAIAGESPTAFFNIIGEKPKDFKPMTQGSVRTEGVNTQPKAGTRNWRYYQELRKSDPRTYTTLQDQMLQDRQKMGDDFYK